LEASYKGLFNALIRREHELGENKRLLDKQNRVQSILVNLREQGATEEQLAEVHEMITPPENDLLNRIHASVDHLTLGQIQVDESVLILESYLKYNAMR
jgi:DNA-directed RNA polymerase III subunit RPC3